MFLLCWNLAGALLGCALSLAAFQGEPKASIEGRVVNALSGEPLRKVNLTLSRIQDKEKPVTAQSDDNGRFTFRDLDPGGYRLAGERTGFQRQDFGARLNPSPGTILAVSPGQALKDLTFKLAPSGVISGRVLDQEGEPMPNVLVGALHRGYTNGKRQWIQSGAAQTNDRGEFRIGNLRAGRYLVTATYMDLGIGLAGVNKDPLPDKPEPAYGTTYYGNSTDLARALPVDVRMGEDRRGTDIQMAKTATVRIRGKVSGAPEGKIVILTLLRKSSAGMGRAPGGVGMVQQTDGTFEIKNVVPGSYALMASSVTEAGTPMGLLPLEAAGQHIEGLQIHLDGGAELSGRFTVAADQAGILKGVTVTLERTDFPLPDTPSARPAENGRFALKNIYAGRHRLRVRGLPENAYVKSVKLGGQEADALDVSGSAPGELEIAVSPAGAQVDGTVLGAGGKPMAGATVAMIPDSRREAHYATATADADGVFRLRGIAPGQYKLLAWEELEAGAHRDPEFVKPLETKAEALSLTENSRAKVTLKAIPLVEDR